ncbi:putative plasmid stability protein [Escherichia coli]|uniref:Putative plasmid stability protein n=8 Tax=Enterobacteriaceae TaxID=543 RepID=A0A2X3JR66_ECOLX|nr:putative plasmid stability protein [Escherichia coli]
MTTPTRRISFYLKPAAVKNEGEACAWLDSLTPEARKSGQRVAFLAGLALLKMNPAEAYRLAAWADDEALSVTQTRTERPASQPVSAAQITSQMAGKYPGVISRITQHQGASALMTLTREHKQGGHNATH